MSRRPLAGATITPEQRAAVLALVQNVGLEAAAVDLELSPHTVTRILSPLPVRQATADLVANKLVAIAQNARS